jgi:hypothetical protein
MGQGCFSKGGTAISTKTLPPVLLSYFGEGERAQHSSSLSAEASYFPRRGWDKSPAGGLFLGP